MKNTSKILVVIVVIILVSFGVYKNRQAHISGADHKIGIITSIYERPGTNYIDIDVDYLEIVPGGPNGVHIENTDPTLVTLHLAPDAHFIMMGPINGPVSFSQFKKYFTGEVAGGEGGYQKDNPWDLTIADGKVIEVKEHFLP
jgi:hypothetical protein